jgi:hypothetical protein
MSGTAIFTGETIQGKAAARWDLVHKACEQFHSFKITVENWSDFKEISYQQIKWWKGILLPALSKDNGDAEHIWEIRLKLAVMPEEFQPETIIIEGKTYTFIPSITKLTMKKLNALMEGSVAQCHAWGFNWITLPDSALRR